jgi:hypothetical protein
MNQSINNIHFDGIDELDRDGFLKVDDFGLTDHLTFSKL